MTRQEKINNIANTIQEWFVNAQEGSETLAWMDSELGEFQDGTHEIFDEWVTDEDTDGLDPEDLRAAWDKARAEIVDLDL